MVEIVAIDSRFCCKVTAEGGNEEDEFFKAAIAVYHALYPTAASEHILLDCLAEIVDYVVNEDAEVLGEQDKEQQDRCVQAVIAALESLCPSIRRDYAIAKLKEFVKKAEP